MGDEGRKFVIESARSRKKKKKKGKKHRTSKEPLKAESIRSNQGTDTSQCVLPPHDHLPFNDSFYAIDANEKKKRNKKKKCLSEWNFRKVERWAKREFSEKVVEAFTGWNACETLIDELGEGKIDGKCLYNISEKRL